MSMVKALELEIKTAKNGGFMVVQNSGKIAFPDKKYPIPESVRPGEKWDLEIFEKSHLKIDFFRFIENSEDRLAFERKKERKLETQKALELYENFEKKYATTKYAVSAEELVKSQKYLLYNKGYLEVAGCKNAIFVFEKQIKKEEEAEKALENFIEISKEKPEKFDCPVPEDLKEKKFSATYKETQEISLYSEGDGMRSGNNVRSSVSYVHIYSVETTSKVKDHQPETEVKIYSGSKEPGEKTICLSWNEVYRSLQKEYESWTENMKPYWLWLEFVKALSLVRKINGIYCFPIFTFEGYPEIYEITLASDIKEDFNYMEVGDWESVENFNM